MNNFQEQFTKPKQQQYKINKIYRFIKRAFYVFYKSIINKEYRVFLFKSLNDKNWYNEKMIQLGLKK